ncbi:hypothetical protein C7402_1411, partial [Paraburkholderia unamae]
WEETKTNAVIIGAPVTLAAPTPTVAANAAAPSEDAYVAQRMTETLAEVYATIIGDDARPEDEALNAIERVKKAAQVLRLEVDLYRAHSEELATTKRLFLAAAADLGAINEALGLDPEDGGAEPIIEAIEELKARTAAQPDEPMSDAEREQFLRMEEQFADCNETDVDHSLLLKWVADGLLDCTHFEITDKGREAIKAASQGAKQ